MARITTTKIHTSGIPLGGIGSGSVELLPDGENLEISISCALTPNLASKNKVVKIPFHST